MKIDTNFQTPPEICEYMADMVPFWSKRILEPTPGIGNLVNALKKLPNVEEIITPDDYFLLNKGQRFDCIVMNPPFTTKSADMTNAPKDLNLKGMKLGYYILKECMKMSDHVIALMPWFTLSDSDVRMRHFTQYGIKSITPLPRKTFQYARIQTVVLELMKGYQSKTKFHTNFF